MIDKIYTNPGFDASVIVIMSVTIVAIVGVGMIIKVLQ
jgi:hypothetical protein